jgi:hypothetical protein
LEYSEWVTRCRICLTSAWNDRVCLSMVFFCDVKRKLAVGFAV